MASAPRTFSFDAVYVVQFLSPDDEPTGRRLFSETIQPIAAGTDIHAYLAEVGTREAFLEAMRSISRECQTKGRLPIIHLETHGSSHGLSSEPTELVAWEELKPLLVGLNEITRNSLLVTLAACHGLHLGKTLITTDRAPLWALIGPDHQVIPTDVANCFRAFYEVFLTGLSLNHALLALREADNSNPYTWKIQTAEVFFAYMFGEYLRAAGSPKQLGELSRIEDDMMATLVLRRRMTAAEARNTRREIRRRLHDYRPDFDRMKHRFLMLDKFPENADRFPITYEQAIQMHAAVQRVIESEAA